MTAIPRSNRITHNFIESHAATIAQHQVDRRNLRVVPVSPSSRGVQLTLDGAVYARFGSLDEAVAAKALLLRLWPPAARAVLVAGGSK